MLTDLDYLRIAYQIAQSSPDPSTQNGALLVDRFGNILVSAVNTFPYDVEQTEERWQRPLKYSFIEHAERNVIYHAARRGVKTAGLRMYCTWFSCADCARAIVQAGILEVIGHDFEAHKTRADWLESIQIGDQILTEGGVIFRRIPGDIGGVKIRYNGVEVEP